MRFICAFVIFSWITLWTAGCATNASIEVKRIETPKSDQYLQPDSRYGRLALQVQNYLTVYVRKCDEISNRVSEMDAGNMTGPDSQSFEKMKKQALSVIGNVKTTADDAEKKLSDLFTQPDFGKPDVLRKILWGTMAIANGQVQLHELYLQYRSIAKRDSNVTQFKLIKQEFDSLAASAGNAVNTMSEEFAASVGFGGYNSTSVYEINPADPQYGEVLSQAKRTMFTSAQVDAYGDASIMLVMESPAQVRVYQVSNDPTKLTQNIGLIVQKAVSASLKVASMAF